MRAGLQLDTRIRNISIATHVGVGAPSAVTSFPVLYSYDFNDPSSYVRSGGNITTLKKSTVDTSSISNILLATGTVGPVLSNRANGKLAGYFTAASSQQLRSSEGAVPSFPGTGITVIAIFEPASVVANACVFEIGNAFQSNTINRYRLSMSSTTGYTFRKADSSGNYQLSSSGGTYTTGLHLLVARSYATTGGISLNIDGSSTPIGVTSASASPPTSASMSPDYTVIGNIVDNSGTSAYFDGYVYRILTYSGPITDAETEAVAVWAATNYGTPNNA